MNTLLPDQFFLCRKFISVSGRNSDNIAYNNSRRSLTQMYTTLTNPISFYECLI